MHITNKQTYMLSEITEDELNWLNLVIAHRISELGSHLVDDEVAKEYHALNRLNREINELQEELA